MSHTITAMFDQRSDAEAAQEQLKDARIDASHIHLHDKSSDGFNDESYSTHEDRGMWEKIKNALMPDEDRHVYEEGVRRGSTLLTVDVDMDQTDEALRVLDQCNGVDIDDRSQQWRAAGWNPATASAGSGSVGTSTSDAFVGATTADTALRAENKVGASGEEVIQLVEEQLVVGKREVDRGGARVRSYVSEVPVHEQIRLRDERVQVTRRKVDQPLSEVDGDAFRERTVDMTATGEEAVISKKAHVVEEVVISKTSEEHVQQIDDTVRRTEVDIDNDNENGVDPRTDSNPRR